MKQLFCLAAVATLFASYAAAQDPPSRIARLNYTDGNVSMQPAGLQDWTPAEINRPFTTGDSLYADAGAHAEFHLDCAIIRANEYTNFSFLTLNDQTIQISLTEGDLYINLHDLSAAQTLEVDSPNASITLLRPGAYRFRIASNGTMTFVVVREGEAEVTSGGQALSLTPGNSAALTGTDSLASTIAPAPPPDDFDAWSQDRDAREARSASLRYLPRSVIGYEDMEGYGDWQPTEGYGDVWYPRAVAEGWAPYHNGHWAWIEPWGWTWVDDAPWGFAPFHYGRWAFISGRWGWSPGPIVVVANRPPIMRPVYAPALVAWFGGSHFGIGITIGGGGPSLGWVPLGYGEVYTPSYNCSPRYFNSVNVSNTTVVKTVNITNVYNTVYVNKTVYNQKFVNVRAPNAVTAMPQNAFASGRSVAQAGVAMRQNQIQNIQAQGANVNAPPVAPTRQALMASRFNAAPVARPAAQIATREVMVQHPPAAAPAPFAARQPYLQQHVGETHDFASMHSQVAPNNPTPQYTRVNTAPAPGARQMNTPIPPRQPQPQSQPYAPANGPHPQPSQLQPYTAPVVPHASPVPPPVEPRNTPVVPRNTPVVPRNTPGEPRNTPGEPRNTPGEPRNTPVAPQSQPIAPRNQPVEPRTPPPPPRPAIINAPPSAPRVYPERERVVKPPPPPVQAPPKHADDPKKKPDHQ